MRDKLISFHLVTFLPRSPLSIIAPIIVDPNQAGSIFTHFLYHPALAVCYVSHVDQLSTEKWNTLKQVLSRLESAIFELLQNMPAVGIFHWLLFVFSWRMCLMPTSYYWCRVCSRCCRILFTCKDKSFKRFLQDDFLCNFLTRFVVCSLTLSSHLAFKGEKVCSTIILWRTSFPIFGCLCLDLRDVPAVCLRLRSPGYCCLSSASNLLYFSHVQHQPSCYPPLPPSILSSPELYNILREVIDLLDVGSLYDGMKS